MKTETFKATRVSKNISNYKVSLEGVEFDNLNYDQYMILTKYTDDI